MAEAADRLGQRRDGDGRLFIGRRHLRQQALDGGAIIGQQLALRLPFSRAAEDVEAPAEQALQTCEHPHCCHHPWAELRLERLPGEIVPPPEDGRCEMEGQLVVALELLGDGFGELAVSIKARHFIFVLDRHELEQVPCHGER